MERVIILSQLSIWGTLKSRLLSTALTRVGFWSGKMYDFSLDSGAITLCENKSPDVRKWIVIIGRSQYFESQKIYPIGQSRDVKKAIRHEAWRFPYPGKHLFKILMETENSHRVSSWVIKSDIIDNFHKKPFFIVPESACVEQLASQTTSSFTS